MRLADLLSLPLVALWQQKSRTLLTTLGVVFGSFVLAASLSIGQGVQDTIDGISRRSDLMRKMVVSRGWRLPESKVKEVQVEGKMSPAKRARLRQAIADHDARFNSRSVSQPLTRSRLAELASLEHVEAAVPMLQVRPTFAMLDDRAEETAMASVRPRDETCLKRLIAGRLFQAADERAVVVSEFLLYRFGLVGDADVESALGKTLRLEVRMHFLQPGLEVYLVKPAGAQTTHDERAVLDKLTAQLTGQLDRFGLSAAEIELLNKTIQSQSSPRLLYAVELPIVGVLREPSNDDEAQLWNPLAVRGDCLVPYEALLNLADEAYGSNEWDLDRVVVIVDDDQYTREVYEKIKQTGLSVFAPLEEVDRERLTYTLIFGGMTCVAAVALIVSALGIANTMLMSVLERTREIGIMKALGAGHWQLQCVFLIEGALIGLVGGAVGLVLAWAASYPGDAWIHSMVRGNFPVELEDPLFVFPAWLGAIVLVLAVVVTTLAAVLPARRAAAIDPVAALRHE